MDTGLHSNPLLTPETCRLWLGGLPAGDPQATLNTIAGALEDLPDRGSMAALKVLEVMREPVLQLQETLSAKYADKLLPLIPAQSAALATSLLVSRRMAEACAAGVTTARQQGGEYATMLPLLLQRAIHWAVQGMIECGRARQRVPDILWQVAQDALITAQRCGVSDGPVRDRLHPDRRSTAAQTYVRGLLLQMAGPRSLSAREFDYVRQVALAFERKPVLTIGADSAAAPASGDAKQRLVRAGKLEHLLDVSALARSVGGRLTELNRGNLFESPVLTPVASPAILRTLFGKLYGAWCARSNMRRFPRRQRSETMYCAFDAGQIYALMKRREFEPPPAPKVYSHVEVANIFLNAGDIPFREQGYTVESWHKVLGTLDAWQMIEESASGLSMRRAVAAGSGRVRRGQLLALRHGPEGTAMIGEIRWAEQTADGHVEIGVEMLPGLARAGAARYAEAAVIAKLPAGKVHCTPALILDNFKRGRGGPRAEHDAATGAVPTGPANPLGKPIALPSINSEIKQDAAIDGRRDYTAQATVLLPAGWTQTGHVVEFIDGPHSFRIKVLAVAARHGEFERLQFELIS